MGYIMQHTDSGFLNNDFRTCLYRLMTHGYESQPRGTATRELLNYNITLKNPRNRVITFPERKTNTRYLLGEFIWYLSGSSEPTGILPYSKFWDNIRNSGAEPGYKEGAVNSNYGTRLFGKVDAPSAFSTETKRPINQWQQTIELLRRDKDTRQAVMNIHVPSDRHTGNKDVPCTLTLQWFIREDRLHLIVNMRSNDVILGFTNDVFQFTMLQEAMLLELRRFYPELKLGFYYHNAGSMHIYDRHFEMARGVVANESAIDLSMIEMDRFDENVINLLIELEAQWQKAGASSDFNFYELPSFQALTPYWRLIVLAFFAQDEDALHSIFGQEHDK